MKDLLTNHFSTLFTSQLPNTPLTHLTNLFTDVISPEESVSLSVIPTYQEILHSLNIHTWSKENAHHFQLFDAIAFDQVWMLRNKIRFHPTTVINPIQAANLISWQSKDHLMAWETV